VVHLDAGYDYQTCRQVLAARGMAGEIAPRGRPAPVQATRAGRWSAPMRGATSTASWCTERRRIVVQFWLTLAAAAIVCGQLVRRAWTSYRWDGRPHRRP
jgi:hypothetical protein